MKPEIYMVSGRTPKRPEYTDNPVGYEQLAVADSAVGLASIPLNANKAFVVVEDATIRYRLDGTNPTDSVGTKAFVNTEFYLNSRSQITNFKAIRQGSTSAKLSVNYYERK